jgi:hypothetical protein
LRFGKFKVAQAQRQAHALHVMLFPPGNQFTTITPLIWFEL